MFSGHVNFHILNLIECRVMCLPVVSSLELLRRSWNLFSFHVDYAPTLHTPATGWGGGGGRIPEGLTGELRRALSYREVNSWLWNVLLVGNVCLPGSSGCGTI